MKRTLLLVFLFVLLGGCSLIEQPSTNTPTSQATFTPLPTETMVHPTLTLTPTLIPTATITSFPTWTPLPTLVGQNSFLDFISFTENSTCKLPCWAGIVPGKTNWDEALFLLNPAASVAKFTPHLNWESHFGTANSIVWSSSNDETITGGFVDAIVADQTIINWVNMTMEGSSMPTAKTPSHVLPLPRQFNLQSVLKEYGIPSSVFIYTYVDDRATDHLSFKVLLVYAENQFYIEYHRFAKLNGGSIVACRPEHYFDLLIEDSMDKLISADAIAKTFETKELKIENWKPIE